METQRQLPEIWYSEKHCDTAFSFLVTDVLFSQQSPFQHVCIIVSKSLGKVLLNDGVVMLSERDEFIYHEMIAHVPLFAHPQPRKVLIIGGGDGGSAREVLRHSDIELCVQVEIDAMVVDACREHLPEISRGAFSDPRFRLVIEDGVRYVAQSEEKFDVILIDSTDPVGPAKPLFGTEFYQNVATRCLAPKGIVVAQAESPFYDVSLQTVVIGSTEPGISPASSL